MSSAPHLPPKSCTIETHRRMQHIPWFVLVIVVSVVAGGSAALMAASWLMPTFFTNTSVYIRNRAGQEPVNPAVDPLFERQVNQRIVTLFDARKQVAPTFFSSDARVGHAALLSSDGWGVIRDEQYDAGDEQYWHAVDAQGRKLRIEKVVADAKYHLVYIKFQNKDGLQVFSFFPWEQLSAHAPAWALNTKTWEKTTLDTEEIVSLGVAAPLGLQAGFRPETTVRDGALIISEQGQLIGFGSKDKLIIPVYVIGYQLPQVVSKGHIEYRALPITGVIIEERITDVEATAVNGFYVSSVSGAAFKKILQPGDVIVRIEGRAVTAAQLPYILFTTGNDISLDVWRNGQTRTVQAVKEIVGT